MENSTYGNLGSKKTSTKRVSKRRLRRPKGRSIRTYQNKIRELTKFYNQTFKHSQQQKIRNGKLPENKQPRKKYFCDRYPKCEVFLSTIKVKQPNIKKD